MSPKPIFVIGMNRSGTKWLTNLLCNHSQTLGVQTQIHNGILETNMFEALPHLFPNLARDEEWHALVQLWCTTDFVCATGFGPDFFYAAEPRPRDCFQMFQLLLDAYATREGKPHWVQKTSPLRAPRVRDAFPDARYVVIQRDIVATLKSNLQRHPWRKTTVGIIKKTFAHVVQEQALARIRRWPHTAFTTYEQLRAEPQQTLREICEHFGLAYEPDMHELPFQPNTTFRKGGDRAKVFSPAQERLIRVSAALFRRLPHAISLPLYRFLKRKQPLVLVEGTFAEIQHANEAS